CVSGMSISGDARLDDKKVSKEVYKQHVQNEKERQERTYQYLKTIDRKLDKALGIDK
ncbi:unnamed protein product, partial [marine sediment metagenome]